VIEEEIDEQEDHMEIGQLIQKEIEIDLYIRKKSSEINQHIQEEIEEIYLPLAGQLILKENSDQKKSSDRKKTSEIILRENHSENNKIRVKLCSMAGFFLFFKYLYILLEKNFLFH